MRRILAFLVESNNTTKLRDAWELLNDDVGSSAIVVHFHKLPFINLLVVLTSKCVRRLCLTTEKLEQHNELEIGKILVLKLETMKQLESVLEELEYKNLISQFASQKARKIDFKWNVL